jgi:MATE family multidrug resistance protein
MVTTARRATALYAAVFTSVGIFDAAVFFLLRNELPKIISNDDYVRSIATKSMKTVAVFQIIDAINVGANGVLRGLGRQSFAGIVVFPVNYLFAVPFAIWLELGSPDLKIDGTWIGLGLGLVISVSIICVYMKSMRWQDCVDSVKSREEA